MRDHKLQVTQAKSKLFLISLIFLVLGIRIASAFDVEWISPSNLEYGYNYITIKVKNNANYQVGTSVYVFSKTRDVKMVETYEYVIFEPYEEKYISYRVLIEGNVKKAKFAVIVSDYTKEFEIPVAYREEEGSKIDIDAWPSSSVVKQGDTLTVYVKAINNANREVKGRIIIEAWDRIEKDITVDANSYKVEKFDIKVPTYFSGTKIINVSLTADNQKVSKSFSIIVQKSAELEIVEVNAPKFVKVDEPFSISIKYKLNTPAVVYLKVYLAKNGQEFTLWKDYAENGYTGVNTHTFRDLTIDKEGEYKIKVEAIAEFDMDSEFLDIYVGKIDEIKLSDIELSPKKVDNSRSYLITVKFKIYSPERGDVDINIRVDGKIVKSFNYYVSEGVNDINSYISTESYPINKKPGKYAVDVYAIFNNKYAVSNPSILEIYEAHKNETEGKEVKEKEEKGEVVKFNAVVFPKKIDVVRGSGTSGYILIENKEKSSVEFRIKTDTSWVYVNKEYIVVEPDKSERVYFYVSPPQALGMHKVSFFVYPESNPDLVEKLEIDVYVPEYIKTGGIKSKETKLNTKALLYVAYILIPIIAILLMSALRRKEEERIV